MVQSGRAVGEHMENAGSLIVGGELIDYPGCYMIEVRVKDGSNSWSVVRKRDNTWWWVAVTNIFPPSGGALSLELGDQIIEPKTLAWCNEQYSALIQKLHEKE